jgi:hypothetical protein
LENRHLLTGAAEVFEVFEAFEECGLTAEPALFADALEFDVAIETSPDAAASLDFAMPMLMAFALEVPAEEELPAEDAQPQSEPERWEAEPISSLAFADQGEFEGPVRMSLTRASVEADESLDLENPQLMLYTMMEPELLQESAEDGVLLSTMDSAAEMLLLSAIGPSPWQNPDNPLDVNVDGLTTPIDALLVINKINADTPLTAVRMSVFVDVNGDRQINPDDALQVVNALNETEGAPAAVTDISRVAPVWYDRFSSDESAPDESTRLEASHAEEEADEIEPLRVSAVMARRTEDAAWYDAEQEIDAKPLPEDLASEVFAADFDWLL